MKSRMPLILGLILATVLAAGADAQDKSDPRLLTLDRIFNNGEFTPEAFGPISWMKDGESYTALEPSPTLKKGQDLVLIRADSGKKTIFVAAENLIPAGASDPLVIESYQWSADAAKLLIFTNSQRVWRRNTRGDYWIWDRSAGKLTRLGTSFPPSTLMFAKLSPDGSRVAYVQKNDLYVETIATGSVLRLTWDGSDTLINGTGDWVYEEEFDLRDGFRWSPDGRFLAFWQFDASGVPDFSLIDNTSALYPKVTTIKYPKAGQRNSACRVGVVSASGGYPVWMRTPGDPRNTYIPVLEWAASSREVIFQLLNRLQNTNDVLIGDAATGAVRHVFTDRDEAWVDVVEEFSWLGDGSSFLWLSEKDGWRHIYRVARETGAASLLTPGNYDVLAVDFIDEKAGRIYFTASPEDATKRYLYRGRLDGKGKAERVGGGGQGGTHVYEFSPNGRWAIHTWSALGVPPVTDLVRLPRHESVRVLAANAALEEKVGALARSSVEFFKLDIGGGVQVDGWAILPPSLVAGKKYPLLVYVYGEPAGQTAADRWGGSGYLWHLMLAQQGMIVASFDNRGTPAPRGREWRKSIYRQVGILASADQAAALRAFLAARPYADPERVGVWGWSGGGTMTLNAMFRYPDLYKTGIAVASVPDQRYYDSIYQERYMGLPRGNPGGYRNGSPIAFAGNLKGSLLLVHGTGDDNVHYQGFEALVNELIARGRSFTMMSYPNRSHGIFEGQGTTMHLYNLMTDFLRTHLPPGPR